MPDCTTQITELIDFRFGLWTPVGQKHKLRSYSLDGANVGQPAEYD